MDNDIDKYYDFLVFEMERLPKGRIFKIREIIGEENWRHINSNIKRNLGKKFYKEVENNKVKDVEIIVTKSEQGVQSYKKI